MLKSSSPNTTGKWVWWFFLLIAPVLAALLLTLGAAALPVGVIVTAIPVYVTHRLLGDTWKTRRIILALFALLVAAAVIIAFTDPDKPSAMYIPSWLSSLFGFYFMAAPIVMTACVLVELHRVKIDH